MSTGTTASADSRVPRRLVLIPRAQARLVDTTRIEPGYPKGYTPEQMRGWAEDVKQYNNTSPEELARLRSTSPAWLSPDQQRLLDVEHYYFEEPDRGIKGSLRPDQTVEIDGGRHRAGYMVEQGVDPVPVWVSAPSERELEDFDAQCQGERQQARTEPPPRVAMEQKREKSPERTAARTEDQRGTRTER